MRLRILALCLLLFSLCLFLSSCDTVQLSPEDLMRPPVLTEEQTEIYAAAEQVIGSGVIFKYPNVGGVHSSFVLRDYDGDGEEEALVFYQTSRDSSIRINVLDKTDGAWYSIGDVEGAGTDVENITFANLYSTSRVDLIVEWSNVSGTDKVVTVLTLRENRLETLFSNSYASMAVLDMDRDGLEDIVVLTGNYGTRQSAAMLVKSLEDGSLSVVSSCTMSPETYEYKQLIKTLTDDGEVALLVDGSVAQGAMVSELIACVDGKLENLIYSDNPLLDKVYRTYRAYEVLSSDIDYDGTAEIPALSQLPNLDVSTVTTEPVYLTSWMKLVDDEFEVTLSAVVNSTYGYYLIYPEAWKNQVSVVSEKPNEWVFTEYTVSEEDQSVVVGSSLLRLLVFRKDEFYDEFDTDGYELIYQNDTYDYYMSINYVRDELQLTREEVLEMFVPISS